MNFSPSRFAVARGVREINKKEFAELAGVTQHTVGRWEKGDTTPDVYHVNVIADLLKFPTQFFFGDDVDIPTKETASFRSQKAMNAAIRDASLGTGSLGFIISDWLDSEFNLPDPEIPDLGHFVPDEADAAARALRQEWGLGEIPITNMLHLLESKGARVYSLAHQTAKVNAFALWRKERPYVFLNNFKSAESSRFDAAHELGHLVLHQDVKVKGREAEDQANRFSSSFLMPRADVLAEVKNNCTLDSLILSKKRWRVSLMALLWRVHDLGLISDWKYRDYCIEATRLGYRTEEPSPIERESSLVWTKLLKMLWAESQSLSYISEKTLIPLSEVESMIYGILGGAQLSAGPIRRQSLGIIS